jgi:uncharacterized membrane protein (DUF106 family)
MTSLFGGGGVQKARDEAQQTAKESREMQRVANDRQLAELNRSSERVAASRRNPRGRRLFTDPNAKSNLS